MKVILRRTTALLIVIGLAAACSAEQVDKAGGDTVVLQLASIDPVNSNGQSYGVQAFVESLGEVSEGRLQVEVNDTYGDGAPDAESDLVAGIASGEIDGGWPSTRAFSEAGIPGLEAVEAPMTITSYEAQKALVADPVAQEMLQGLDGSGVIGLGLAVGPLRRPFSSTPLLDPQDWAGARFRVFNSPVQTEAVSALGAEPVNAGFDWLQQVRTGELDGAEFDIAQYQANGYTTDAGNVTSNVALWPKMFVLSISEARFVALTGEQQAWVREAAEQAVQTSVEADYDESTPAMQLCESGMRFLEATPQQVTELGDLLAPVIAQMAGDPGIGPTLARVQEVAALSGGTYVPDVAEECSQTTETAARPETPPAEVAGIPDGLYRAEVSEADVTAGGHDNGSGWSGVWSLQIEDGTYAINCRPLDLPGKDCGNLTFDDVVTFDSVLEAGYVRGSEDVVYFVYDAQVHSDLSGCELPCFPASTYSVVWELEGEEITFGDLQGAGPVGQGTEPWRKID
jgi:TRAP-type C4-dicarboxylate transport system substrate-binding protein